MVGIDLDEPSISYGRDLLRRNSLAPDALRVADLGLSTLSTIRDRLRPGGRLLVTVPNGYGWFELEARLWFWAGIARLFHRRWPNPDHLSRVLARGSWLVSYGG